MTWNPFARELPVVIPESLVTCPICHHATLETMDPAG
jgi:hypothetical protein